MPSSSTPSFSSPSSPPSPFTIPTIDISPYLLSPTSPASTALIASIRTACTTTGFFQITGHGIPRDLQDRVLAGAAAFFALSLAEKSKLARATLPGPSNRGYERIGSQTLGGADQEVGDFKEGFYISTPLPPTSPPALAHPSFHGPNTYPPTSLLPRSLFQDPLESYHTHLTLLIPPLLALLAATLPYGPSIFTPILAPLPLSILRPLHYPPSPAGTLGAGAHSDFGALTLLLQDDAGGLEVRHEGRWVPVPPDRDALVVNIGDMLERWTGGRYKSTLHRVVSTGAERDRYSVPFFFDGNLEARLVPFGREGEEGMEEVVTVEQHLVERFRSTYTQK